MEKALQQLETEIKKELDRKDRAREAVLPACRELVRMASEVIKEVHRHKWPEARSHLVKAGLSLREIQERVAKHPDLRFAGFVTMAEKEYAEAAITLAVLNEKRLPTLDEIGVHAPEYLNGMAESIGEMRRHLLDQLRKDRLAEAERILQVMDSFYHFLFSLDYPDAILRGLRRMVDSDRGILERTRGDLTTTLVQEKLRRELRQAAGRNGGKRPARAAR
ncbi:MAG TPA: hypothetical protein PKN80_05050 [bacterium]|uniref:Translin family protein n=1 Tax=candidate division TA06 bacterium ADurb.Bin417 TaxID=1852828 RepID=A0A1V5MIX1_UNCT6|nr:MAG: Translin family protein [candidate division TA06 bacterium ADurb.Bin417]HNQ35417.1 hypothetical protein [bacterium]HNS48640.1 hypothetical protein [bacterium]